MEENYVIGIEGLVGAGKTSICKELLNKIPNSILVNGGNFYRAIVYAVIKSGIDKKTLLENASHIDSKELMEKLRIEVRIENRETEIYIDGNKLTQEVLQSKDASMAVSEVALSAKNDALYVFGANFIDNLRKKFNIIFSGRDIMKIYPDTKYHFFVTADINSRVQRKSMQYEGKVDESELKEHIVRRDKLQEEAGFYKTYDNTIIIDTTDCKTVDEATEKVFAHIN